MRSPIAKEYWPAMGWSVFFQFCVLSFVYFSVDVIFLVLSIPAVAYWIIAAAIMIRRPRNPTPGDLMVVRTGYGFFLVLLIAAGVIYGLAWEALGR